MYRDTVSTRLYPEPVQTTVGIPAGTIAYTRVGRGPVILLVHGLGGTRGTWKRVIKGLSRTHTVIAPDLPGHGESEAPAGDYSLGAHASALRDLLVSLRIPSATVIGHSLGGGVAMQFAYQFPERIDRLVLISSGGLGAEVTPLLRFASSAPGASAVLRTLAAIPTPVVSALFRAVAVVPRASPRTDVESLMAGLKRLREAGQRRTFIRTARSVIDWRGQSVSATRQLATFSRMPVLLVWGSRDRTIPPRHHAVVVDMLDQCHTLELPNAGHFPHETEPEAAVAAITRFLTVTKPYRFSETAWRRTFPAVTAEGTSRSAVASLGH